MVGNGTLTGCNEEERLEKGFCILQQLRKNIFFLYQTNEQQTFIRAITEDKKEDYSTITTEDRERKRK